MSVPSARKPRRNPRRKAGKAATKQGQRKIHFRLTVEAQEMIVVYTPNYTKGDDATGHFEFNSPHKPARRIIVSESGYRSHFALMDEVKAAPSPKAYALETVLEHLRQSAKGSRSRDERQLALF